MWTLPGHRPVVLATAVASGAALEDGNLVQCKQLGGPQLFEWAAGALSVAGLLLRHFIEGPERQLRKKKLQLEIEALSKAQGNEVSQKELQEFHKQVLDEVRILSANIPEVKYTSPVISGPTLTLVGDAQGAVSRLAIAIAARRAELSGQHAEPAPGPRETPPVQAESHPEVADDPLIEWDEPDPAQAPTPLDVEARLRSLDARIRDRRRADKS